LIDLSYSIAVVGYGIALEKYRLFNLVMILRRQDHGDADTITNDFQFCKDFLIDFILRIERSETNFPIYRE